MLLTIVMQNCTQICYFIAANTKVYINKVNVIFMWNFVFNLFIYILKYLCPMSLIIIKSFALLV